MTKYFRGEGKVLTCVAPLGGVTSGQLVLIEEMFGVAATSAAQGESFELNLTGIHNLPKAGSQAWKVGDAIYWDNTNHVATTVSTSNTKIGVAAAVAASADTRGDVRLNGAF